MDSAGDESVKSAPAAVTIPQADESSAAAGGGGGGGCFVETVRPYDACASAVSTAMAVFAALGTVALPVCRRWSGSRKGRYVRR